MKTKLYLLIGCVTIVLSSCNHKDLCYDHTHNSRLQVRYDWSFAPEASPSGMSVFFYPADNNNQNSRFDFPNAIGGEVQLNLGNYLLISYNNDTEVTQFSGNENFTTHKAVTREGDILEPMYGNGVTSSLNGEGSERVIVTPDQLYCCNVTDLTVSYQGVSYTMSRADNDIDSVHTITLQPHDPLCHYSYEVRNVKNINNISKISAAISGMAGSMNLMDESLDDEPVTLPVPAQTNNSSNTITGQFLTFGHNESNTDPHKMSFYVVTTDGSKYSIKDLSKLDVTSQVHSAPDRQHVHIIIDGLEIPDTQSVGEDFVPKVEDWGVINEDIIL